MIFGCAEGQVVVVVNVDLVQFVKITEIVKKKYMFKFGQMLDNFFFAKGKGRWLLVMIPESEEAAWS